MPLETMQTIGYTIDLTKGSHLNTEYKAEKLQLKEIGFTNEDEITYATHGEWTSEIVAFKDEYLSLENLAIGSISATNGSTYKAYTRTSSNGTLWEEYKLIDEETGKMQSTKNKFLQIRIEFIGKEEKIESLVESFSKNSSRNRYNNNEYIEIDDGLKLKREYDYKMIKDNAWSDDGYLLRKKIKKSELKKVDSLTIQ